MLRLLGEPVLGRTDGNCSAILTDPSYTTDPDERAGAVLAYERWDLAVENLSLGDSGDEDFYAFTVPETDTPTLPEPECGVQNVTIGGEEKEIKTEGTLTITVDSTATSLGEDGVRTAGPGTPITVYDGSGSEVTAGRTTATPGRVSRRIDCPRNKGLTDPTVSFGEGVLRNVGTYRLDVSYGIDVTRTNDAANISRARGIAAAEAERLERYIVAAETLDQECLTPGDCLILRSHPTLGDPGENVCRPTFCVQPTIVPVRGSGTFELSAVGHPDLAFELRTLGGEPVAASRPAGTFTAPEFTRWLADVGYGQWVGGLGTEGVVGLMNQPAPGGARELATTDGESAVVAERERLAVEDLQSGAYRLVIEGPPGNYWLETFDRPPVPDDREPAGPGVRLVPTTESVSVGETTTFDVQVTDVEGGVGSYELTVATDDAAVARIVGADNRIGGTGRIEPGPDGTSVRLGAFAGDTPDTGDVSIATVTVAGVEPGTAGLELAVDSVADETGAGYGITTGDLATVTVREEPAAPEVVPGSPATDPDGDGVYEDVNGDEEVNPGDATVLFNAVFEDNPAVTDNPEQFDLNRDGGVTPGDATVLFDEVFG